MVAYLKGVLAFLLPEIGYEARILLNGTQVKQVH